MYHKTLLIFFTISLFLFTPQIVRSQQSNTYSDAAKAQLAKALANGDLKKDIDEAGIKGTYQFDITIYERGEVLTVFAHSTESTDIPSQNALKTLIKDFRFDLKIPNGVRVKFNYIFNL
jgi:hypothetical protein